MTWNRCHRCKCQMWIPDELNSAALHKRGPEGIHFYCAYGHGQHYADGESDLDKMRRERDHLAQQLAYKDDRIKTLCDDAEAADRRAAAAKGQVTKLKKRASAGTCPCCSRTFSNMSEHMKKQHPEFVTESGAKVVRLKVARSGGATT
jgi:hypothetical protein